MSRKERRAAEHQARKAARKTGFPITSQPTSPDAAVAPSPALIADLHLLRPNDPPTPSPVLNISNRTASVNERDRISPARLAANRANAQLSKGAVTEIVRTISSQNRLTHGLARHNGVFAILSTEDPLGFEALKQTLAEEHEPTTETESILVNGMAESHWLANRAQNLQASCFDPATGVVSNEKMFSLYLRYQTTHTRAFHKSLNDLLKLRSERRKSEIGFEAQKGKLALQRSTNEMQELKNKILKIDLLEKNPLYNADYAHLTHLASTSSPEFRRMKNEFDAKYFAAA